MKNAAPKSMPAVTATWPRKLNQPVNQDQAAPCREARADLGHRQADEQGHDADDRPAPHDDGGSAGAHAVAIQGETAGQDRDDRERDREVGESGHPSAQLLGIAKLVQGLLVTAERRLGRLLVDRHRMLLESGARPVQMPVWPAAGSQWSNIRPMMGGSAEMYKPLGRIPPGGSRDTGTRARGGPACRFTGALQPSRRLRR